MRPVNWRKYTKTYVAIDGVDICEYNGINSEGGGDMARSAAEDRAIRKYEKEKIDKIMIRVPKGMKEIVRNFAADHGESLNGFIQRAIYETMARDGQIIREENKAE